MTAKAGFYPRKKIYIKKCGVVDVKSEEGGGGGKYPLEAIPLRWPYFRDQISSGRGGGANLILYECVSAPPGTFNILDIFINDV